MNHSPLPWKANLQDVSASDGYVVMGPWEGKLEGHQDEPNRDFIVVACNNYERVLAERDALLEDKTKTRELLNEAMVMLDWYVYDDTASGTSYCIECDADLPNHEPDCRCAVLKAKVEGLK